MARGRESRCVRAGASSAAVLLLALAFADGGVIAAQGAADPAPSGRNKPVFAFDPTRKTMVLFGGFANADPFVLGDGWEWGDGAWKRIERAAFPPRAAAGVATDTRRGRIVLFGGHDGAGACGDTLEWDGKSWARIAWTGPPARTAGQLAYDARRGRTVMFGGFGVDEHTLGDTWEWDGARWTKMADTGPPARFQHVLVYDAGRGRVVLFGGNGARGRVVPEMLNKNMLDDTWEWDGVKWTRAAGAGPSARDHHAMAYDEARGKVVLFGGWDGKFLDDVWEWDGTWRRVEAKGPSARGGLPSMTYDPQRRTVFLYGGGGEEGLLTDVWRWDGRAWTRLL